MGDSLSYQAVYIGQDALKSDKPDELGQAYLIQVDVDIDGKVHRLFVDATTLVNRAKDGSLPSSGEYWLAASDDWYDKHGEYKG